MALGRKASAEPLSSEDMALLAAVAAQAATALENGRLYRQLRGQGRRARADARVQREHPGVAERRPRRRQPRRSDRSLEPPARRAVWDPARRCGDPAARRNLRARVPRGAASARRESPEGAAFYRVPLLTRHDVPRRLLVNVATTPLRDSDGAIAGTIVVIEDISARVQLEEQLQISEKMASIGLLAAGVAHEVNTPLTGISSFTQMLLQGAERGRSEDQGAGKDRAADVPRREDRQRAAESGPAGTDRQRPGRRQRGHQRRARRCSSTSCAPAASSVRKELSTDTAHRAGHRIQAAAGVLESVPQRARRDAQRRLADDRHAGPTRQARSSRLATPGPGSPPSSSPASTIRSSRPRKSARAPASACRSPTASCRSTEGRSPATARSGRARGSRCRFRWRRRGRAADARPAIRQA